MTSPTRTFFVMLALTVTAATIAGWTGVQVGLSSSQGAADLDTIIHRELQLTVPQMERIRALEQEFGAQRTALQQDMRAANRALARAILQEGSSRLEARQAIERVQTAFGELQTKTVEHVLAVRAILSPTQAKAFDAEVAKALGVTAQ